MIIQRTTAGIMAGLYALSFIWANIIPDDRYATSSGGLFSPYSIWAIILFLLSIITVWLFNPKNISQPRKTSGYILLIIISVPIIYLFVNLLKPLL